MATLAELQNAKEKMERASGEMDALQDLSAFLIKQPYDHSCPLSKALTVFIMEKTNLAAIERNTIMSEIR